VHEARLKVLVKMAVGLTVWISQYRTKTAVVRGDVLLLWPSLSQ
jgi:hypothetical protein